MRVLVFDSGVGGLSVVAAMAKAGLACTVDFLADTAWLPYGDKPAEALAARVTALLAAGVRAWEPALAVIACNTASTVAIHAVRSHLTIPVVGVAPPIKPAAEQTRTGVIGVLGTPATIARPMTLDLIAQFAAHCEVVKVGSTALVLAAEAKLRGETFDDAAVKEAVGRLFEGPLGARLDVVALSCTHFPLLLEELTTAAPRPVQWIDSGPAIARRIAAVAGLAPGTGPLRLGRVGFTGPERAVRAAFGGFGFTGFAPALQTAAGFEIAPASPHGAA